jgi:hypothetical protein
MVQDAINLNRKISWRGPEFLYQKKTPLWYTNVCVFFFLALLAFFFIKNYIAIVIVSLLFWYFLDKSDDHPRIVDYSIDKSGIMIDDRKINFGEIHSFTLDDSHKAPVIVCDLNYPLAFPITIVCKDDNVEEVAETLMQFIPFRNEFSLIRWITHWLHY